MAENKLDIGNMLYMAMKPMAAVVDGARAVSNDAGAAPLHAAVRQGADELAQVLTAFPSQGVQPVAESGQLFEPTQQMVTEQMTGRGVDSATDSLRAMMDAKPQQGPKQERGRDR